MNLYMLDTDMASYLIRGDVPSVTKAFARHYPNICISVITYAELQYGMMKRNSRPLTQKVQAFCNLVRIIPWSAEMAVSYAKLRMELEANGNLIGSMDMLIAASALAEGATLVSNNTEHFSRVKGLKLENWMNPHSFTLAKERP